MSPDDSGLSQRERRRQQHHASKPKMQMPRANLKQWFGPMVLLLLVGGVVGIMVLSDDSGNDEVNGCSGHYHYVLDVFVNGDKLLLNAPGDTKFNNVGHNLHMHPTDPGTGSGLNLIHNHFQGGANQGLHKENCFSYGDAFSAVSMEADEQELVLRAVHGEAWQGTYNAEAGKSIRAFGQGYGDTEWTELDLSDLSQMIPPVASRIAIIYGDAGADAQTILDNETTFYPAGTYPPDGNPNDPPHYTSFDELRKK